jgi:erythromycin esterase
MNASQAAAPIQVTGESDAVAHSIAAQASPVADDDGAGLAAGLEPLIEMARDAAIVGVGGSTYGAHEQFAMTFRIIRLLVSELGFRTVATEEDWDVALALDAYVRTGDGDPGVLVSGCGVPWQVEEMRGALEWLRQWNATHEDQVRFAGVGVIDTRPEVYDSITTYVQRVAPSSLAEVERHFAVLRPARPDHVRWFTMEVPDKERYVEHARQVLRVIANLPRPAAADDREHEMIVQHTRQILAFYEHYAFHLVDDGYRDEKMAENLWWLHNHTGHRIAYWSTIAHSACAPDLVVAVPPRGVLRFATTGSHLRKICGDGYVSVGLTYNSGTVNTRWAFPPFTRQPVTTPAQPRGFSEYPLAQAGTPPFALDLRRASAQAELPRDVREWLRGPARTRIIGSIYDSSLPADEFYMTGGTLAEWFDVLIHQDTMTPTREVIQS